MRVLPHACSTCPYLRSTPPGIWDESEYAKLAEYDEQPRVTPVLATFHCHQENATGVDTVCRGWLSTHRDSVAVRLACATGQLVAAQVLALGDEPEYYATGQEATDAGMAGIESPGEAACDAIGRLLKSGAGRGWAKLPSATKYHSFAKRRRRVRSLCGKVVREIPGATINRLTLPHELCQTCLRIEKTA